MSLFENLLQFIIDIYLRILNTFVQFIGLPLINTFVNNVPVVTEYLTYFSNFLIRIFNGVAFAREVFFNVTGYPRALYYALVVFFFFKINNMLIIRARRFVFNVYYLLRGSRSAVKVLNNYGV